LALRCDVIEVGPPRAASSRRRSGAARSVRVLDTQVATDVDLVPLCGHRVTKVKTRPSQNRLIRIEHI